MRYIESVEEFIEAYLEERLGYNLSNLQILFERDWESVARRIEDARTQNPELYALKAEMQERGFFYEKDEAISLQTLDEGAEKGSKRCLYLKAEKAYGAGRYQESLALAQESALLGSARAYNLIAILYAEGKAVERNLEQSKAWLLQAAEKEYPIAYYNLGRLCKESEYALAVQYYEKAAMAGYPPAQERLGFFYLLGRGVKQDYKQALRWYKTAALNGEVQGMWYLASLYEDGDGVEKDPELAEYWYKEAIKLCRGKQASYTASDKLSWVYYYRNLAKDKKDDE